MCDSADQNVVSDRMETETDSLQHILRLTYTERSRIFDFIFFKFLSLFGVSHSEWGMDFFGHFRNFIDGLFVILWHILL